MGKALKARTRKKIIKRIKNIHHRFAKDLLSDVPYTKLNKLLPIINKHEKRFSEQEVYIISLVIYSMFGELEN